MIIALFVFLLSYVASFHLNPLKTATVFRASDEQSYSAVYSNTNTVFSRLIHVSKIPQSESAICRIRANEAERISLAREFDIDTINSFEANATARYADSKTIRIQGVWKVEAQIINSLDSPDEFSEDFETTLLCNYNAKEPIEFDSKKWDDEVPPSGNIDIGSIVMQDFSLNLDTE